MPATYNPFSKEIDQLDSGDLEKLRQVHEGWYVEYKAELPKAKAIAKAISAFANTYGGDVLPKSSLVYFESLLTCNEEGADACARADSLKNRSLG